VSVTGSVEGSAIRWGRLLAGGSRSSGRGFFGIFAAGGAGAGPASSLLLETAWEAIDGRDSFAVAARQASRGVRRGYVQDYSCWAMNSPWMTLQGHAVTGQALSALSGRVSYTLGLEGPAVTVARRALVAGEHLSPCGAALRSGLLAGAAGGVYGACPHPMFFLLCFTHQGAAVCGRACHSYADIHADGGGVVEGVVWLCWSGFSDARRNGHEVLAVVAGHAL